MPPVSQRAAVLYTEFSEALRLGQSDQPMKLDDIQALAALVAQTGGQLVECTATRLYASYPRAMDALGVASRVIERVEENRRRDAGRQSLCARILLGYGEVRIEGNRLQSDWTYKFSRLCTHVPDNRIGLLTEFIQHAGAGLRPPPQPSGVEGLSIMGGEAPAETKLGSAFAAVQAGVFAQLTLRVRGRVISLRPVDCPVLVGRDASCGVQVSSDTASRVHGRIEYENSKFFYVDQSRNGSYVLGGSGQEVHLQQGESTVLAGEGAISTGAPISQQKGEVVRYSCHATKLTLDSGGGDTKAMRKP